jgi:phage shock protein C
MFCTHCGVSLGEPEPNYCSSCGKPTRATAAMNTGPYRKPLVRPLDGRRIGGVCAGIANYLDVDPILVRVLWVVAVFCVGTGLLAYLVAWIIIPNEPYPGAATQPWPTPDQPSRV